jgi:hypothetical protein
LILQEKNFKSAVTAPAGRRRSAGFSHWEKPA